MPTAVSIPNRTAAEEYLAQFGSPMSFKLMNSFSRGVVGAGSPTHGYSHFDSMDGKLSSSLISCSVESESSRLAKALAGPPSLSNAKPQPHQRTALGDYLQNHVGEKEFCRDFTCCGKQLHDLHALVEHFEDVHVRVLPSEFPFPLPPVIVTTPTTVHSVPTAPPPTPSSHGGFDPDDLDMDMDDGTPSPETTSEPQTPLAQPYSSAFDSVILRRGSDLGPAPVFNAALAAAALQRANTIPGPNGLTINTSTNITNTCIQPQLLIRTPVATPHPSPPSSPTKATTPTNSGRPQKVNTLKANPNGRPVIMGPIVPNAATDARPPLPGGKPFRCPQPSCTKSYKQANGLKYHITHGQCSFLPPDPALEHLTDKEAEERLKPFQCAVGAGPDGKGGGCGRRYKNMNGLRYHYQTSGAHGAVGLALLASGNHPNLPSKSRSGSRSRTQSTLTSPLATAPPTIASISNAPTPTGILEHTSGSPDEEDTEEEDDLELEMEMEMDMDS